MMYFFNTKNNNTFPIYILPTKNLGVKSKTSFLISQIGVLKGVEACPFYFSCIYNISIMSMMMNESIRI